MLPQLTTPDCGIGSEVHEAQSLLYSGLLICRDQLSAAGSVSKRKTEDLTFQLFLSTATMHLERG
jgi:hypothetical protein